MTLYFLINNLVFAFGMIGAVVYGMASWLSFDSYKFRRDVPLLLRTVGFGLMALWQITYAANLGNDLLSYFAFVVYVVGLVCVLSSFLKKSELALQAVIVIPAFAMTSHYLFVLSALLLLAIAYLSRRQGKREQNKTWDSFSRSFALVGVGALIGTFAQTAGASGSTALPFIIRLALEVAGFGLIGYWVWQYIQLRIRETVVMASIGAALLLATIVTLAFSTILISRVSDETAKSLITDVKVLDLTVSSLQEESLAKASLVASQSDLSAAMASGDSAALDQIAERYLESYNLGFLTVADRDGNVLVRAHALSRRGDSLSGEAAFDEAVLGKAFATVGPSSVEGLSIRAGAPVVKGGRIIGAVVAGFPLDNAFADKMKKATGLDMFVYDGSKSVAGTAFAQDGATRLVGVDVGDLAVSSDVLVAGKTETASVDMLGEPFQASYGPLQNADGKIIGMLSAGKPEQDIADIGDAANRLTLVTVVIIMLALAAPLTVLAKRLDPKV